MPDEVVSKTDDKTTVPETVAGGKEVTGGAGEGKDEGGKKAEAGAGGDGGDAGKRRVGAGGPGDRDTQNWILRMLATLYANLSSIIVGLLVAAFLFFMYTVLSRTDGDFLNRLREPEYARGLITFIISVSTIILSFVLVISSLFGANNLTEDQYRRGREVFTGLMGVLGTIVGFYFGAAQQTSHPLQLAPLQFEELGALSRVMTFASGGTPPYRYTIQFGGKDNEVAIKNKVSESGWIREDIPAKATNPVEVQVTDKENRQVAARRDREVLPK